MALLVVDDFLNLVFKRLLEIKSFEKKTIFSISTTAKQEQNSYLTPVRVCKDFVIGGCVIFDQKILYHLLREIDGKVDIILSDSEKIIPFHYKNLADSSDKSEADSISNICFQTVKKSEVFEYKPNDLTVNAAWSFLSQNLRSINGLKICILGAGNIGSKLAFKLAECGAEVSITRRNIERGRIIVNGLNLINQEHGCPEIEIYSDALQASLMTNVLIGASNGLSLINEDIVRNVHRDCLILDLGKNNLTQSAIKLANEYSMSIYRTDVTPALEAFVYELLKTKDILEYSCGKRDLGYCKIVSGGFFGVSGDVVVDSIYNPNFVLGVAEGNGLLKQTPNAADEAKIVRLKKEFTIKY